MLPGGLLQVGLLGRGQGPGAGPGQLALGGGPWRVQALDASLWPCPDPVWLPHGTERMGEADLQPIWISAATADAALPPNGARFLFLIDGMIVADFSRFSRVFDLVDGSDEAAVAAAAATRAATMARPRPAAPPERLPSNLPNSSAPMTLLPHLGNNAERRTRMGPLHRSSRLHNETAH